MTLGRTRFLILKEKLTGHGELDSQLLPEVKQTE